MKILKKIFNLKVGVDEIISDGTDVECLKAFMKFMERVEISSEFVENDVGFIIGEVLHIQCGNHLITSPTIKLDWPLEPVVDPEEMVKRKLN